MFFNVFFVFFLLERYFLLTKNCECVHLSRFFTPRVFFKNKWQLQAAIYPPTGIPLIEWPRDSDPPLNSTRGPEPKFAFCFHAPRQRQSVVWQGIFFLKTGLGFGLLVKKGSGNPKLNLILAEFQLKFSPKFKHNLDVNLTKTTLTLFLKFNRNHPKKMPPNPPSGCI